jgi:hypothetical protein
VAHGDIRARRYQSYLDIRDELEETERRHGG